MPKRNKNIDPEMMSLFKIFGISSIVLLSFLTLFNDKKPNIIDQDNKLAINDASRLYFKNVRQLYYDIENRQDAKMNIYRLGKREKGEGQFALNISIIINRLKDEAYLYVEPSPLLEDEEKIQIRWVSENQEESGDITFISGDRYDHYIFVEQIYPLLLKQASFEVKKEDSWFPILHENIQRDAFRITSFDYFRLIGREEMNN